MNLFEEAVIYATVMHSGETRKGTNIPYILHPLEVSHIISTMTDDIEVITAGVLHDIVEDTDGTIKEIRNRFGDRVAELVESETENKYENEDKSATWKRRKEESLRVIQTTDDVGIKMLWLGDKLSNLRSLARKYSEQGNEVWNLFHQKDPNMHRWYYQTIAESVEMELNKTGAFKEMIKHINSIWPGTFHVDKSKYKKYRQLSLDGLTMIGKGAKGEVYRYDDELIVKVYNKNNQFKDIERENELAKKALIAGIPTAISFGIVTIDDRYGSLFELIDSDTMSHLIAKDPSRVTYYAKIMADYALQIHSTDGTEMHLPSYMSEIYRWIDTGIGRIDQDLTQKVTQLINSIPERTTVIHGDFHTGNIMKQRDEFLLIDMDRLSTCHPIAELSGLYTFYVAYGELDPSMVESFMGFSYATSKAFFEEFLHNYLQTDDMDKINAVRNMAALISYVRCCGRAFRHNFVPSPENEAAVQYYIDKIRHLLTCDLSFDI